MSRFVWPLLQGRPRIEIVIPLIPTRGQLVRMVLADTGAGSEHAPFEMALDEKDCLNCGGLAMKQVLLRGAFVGWHRVYTVRVQVPQLSFDEEIEVVGVPQVPFEGIAGFRFLDRFGYGNFGCRGQFGIEL